MSQSSAHPCQNYTMLPIKGFGLAVDTDNLPSPIDYSFEEQWTGKRWVDGKKIYQKTIKLKPLADAGIVETPLDIADLDILVSMVTTINGYGPGGRYACLPHVDANANNTWHIMCMILNGNIRTQTWNKCSVFDRVYATVQYTCTDR